MTVDDTDTVIDAAVELYGPGPVALAALLGIPVPQRGGAA